MTFSTADLAARTIHRRAVEALIWGIPAVNFDLMYQSHVRDAQRRYQSGLVLVPDCKLEEPDAHAEPRHDLPDCRRSGDVNFAGRTPA